MSNFQLSSEFKFALQALQAKASAEALPADTDQTTQRSIAMAEAEKLIAEYDFECSLIVRQLVLAKDSNYKIPTMTEEELSVLLRISDGMGGYWLWLKQTLGEQQSPQIPEGG